MIVLTNASYAGAGDIADAALDDLHPQLFASSSAGVGVGVGGENPAITALVKRLWSGMVSGQVDQSMLSPRMGRFGRLAGARRSQFAVYGVDARWAYRGVRTPPHPGMSLS
ncbi:MAG: hypothetical protein M3N13_07620 [Candidatus Eremiobacteraeota bacterium]|nr:hypothetical protein [Candidatus Eremiobacteraeota bacterium]